MGLRLDVQFALTKRAQTRVASLLSEIRDGHGDWIDSTVLNGYPAAATPGSVGLDLRTMDGLDPLGPGDEVRIATGLMVAIPPGYVGLVCPRSGLAWQYSVTVLNAPGIIDPDYRGEIEVLLKNLSGYEVLTLAMGDRIAQLVIVSAPVVSVQRVLPSQLAETARGAAGWGSTGAA